MKMRLELDMDNAAFEENEREEIGRILLALRDQILNRGMCLRFGEVHRMRDINGNTVGTVRFEE